MNVKRASSTQIAMPKMPVLNTVPTADAPKQLALNSQAGHSQTGQWDDSYERHHRTAPAERFSQEHSTAASFSKQQSIDTEHRQVGQHLVDDLLTIRSHIRFNGTERSSFRSCIETVVSVNGIETGAP